jgi:hypothetical protein
MTSEQFYILLMYKVGAFHVSVRSVPFRRCLSRYKVDALFISNVNVSGFPHPALQSDIVSTVLRNVVTSFGVRSARMVGIFY